MVRDERRRRKSMIMSMVHVRMRRRKEDQLIHSIKWERQSKTIRDI